MRIRHKTDPHRDEGEVTLARHRVRVRVRSTIRDWFSGVERPRGVLASVWNARGAVRTRRGHRGRSRDSVAARADEEVVTLARGA